MTGAGGCLIVSFRLRLIRRALYFIARVSWIMYFNGNSVIHGLCALIAMPLKLSQIKSKCMFSFVQTSNSFSDVNRFLFRNAFAISRVPTIWICDACVVPRTICSTANGRRGRRAYARAGSAARARAD